MAILERVKSAWNAFRYEEQNPAQQYAPELGAAYSYVSSSSPVRVRVPSYNDRYLITSILTRIAVDAASVVFHHAKLDDQGRYIADVSSNFNDCLIREPNLDQGPRAFRQDMVTTALLKGCMAIVPVDTTVDPQSNVVYDIFQLRVGVITTWYPKHVRVDVYNEETGLRQEVTLPKSDVAIVENPLYSVMNEPNSTLQRLIRKLALLDAVDEQSASGKLDLIIQLPYVIKSESRRNQAEKRREDIEFQLKDSKYGIAYIDGTEKITQLNRPAENNLMAQIEFLTKMLYGQLGVTEEVMNGTADEKTMINYWNRSIEPIVESIKEAMHRSFLGPRNMKKNESVLYFKDPFKFIPASSLADIVDKFTRNEILTANEIRGYMGIPPHDDPKADQLQNSNMPQPALGPGVPQDGSAPTLDDLDSIMNQTFDGLSSDIESMANGTANGG